MQILLPDVVVKDTGTVKGFGVYARKAIQRDEVVELCLVIPFKALPPEVMTRVFDWGILANVPDTHAIALGFGSLYNHDNPANMRYSSATEGRSLQFTAVRNIEVGEELTINYNGFAGSPNSSEDHWFDRTGVVPL